MTRWDMAIQQLHKTYEATNMEATAMKAELNPCKFKAGEGGYYAIEAGLESGLAEVCASLLLIMLFVDNSQPYSNTG